MAAAECGAPVMFIAGGEPLLHSEIESIVSALLYQGRYVYLCTNALLLPKRLGRFLPHPRFCWSVHLDGERDCAVCQAGVYDRAVVVITRAKQAGFRVNVNCTLFDGAEPDRIARFLDSVQALAVALRGPRTDGEMAPEIPLDRQRPIEVASAEALKIHQPGE